MIAIVNWSIALLAPVLPLKPLKGNTQKASLIIALDQNTEKEQDKIECDWSFNKKNVVKKQHLL